MTSSCSADKELTFDNTPCSSDAQCSVAGRNTQGLSRECGFEGLCHDAVPGCTNGDCCPAHFIAYATCEDTNFLTVDGVLMEVGDSGGDGCEWYENAPAACGAYDTEDFRAQEMCCVCKSPSSDDIMESCAAPSCRKWAVDSQVPETK